MKSRHSIYSLTTRNKQRINLLRHVSNVQPVRTFYINSPTQPRLDSPNLLEQLLSYTPQKLALAYIARRIRNGPPALLKLACLLLAYMAVAVAPVARAAVTCSQALCIPYMRSDMGPMLASCCNGFKSLDSAAQTMPDCQATCECLKPVSGSISDLNYGVVAGLPEKCGVSIPYKISPGTNCSKFMFCCNVK
ncbi:hypothetical protein ACJRO7_000727 [Eucalyptus globulus]|uniref:Non-specific lipid-transfer protein n=1 Tax=Eucalyptus globulus TaxID=34317 RepID=A0ABD3LPK3_EUCGL